MGAHYDKIEVEDMSWNEAKAVYHYPYTCGDRSEISRKQLANYEDITTCPSCSLMIRVIYDPLDLEDELPDDEAQLKENKEKDDSVSHSDDNHFEDALDQLTLHEESEPAMIAVSA